MLSLMHQLQHLLQACFPGTTIQVWLHQAKAALPIVLSLRQSLQNLIKTREEVNPSDLQTLEYHCYYWLEAIAHSREAQATKDPDLQELVTEMATLYTLLHQQYPDPLLVHPVPAPVKQYHSRQCLAQLQQWRKPLGNAPVHAIYDCCEQIVVRRLHPEETIYFEQLHQVCQLIKRVILMDCPTDSAGGQRLLLLLLSENCNDPLFIERAFDCWVDMAQNTQSITEMLEFWLQMEQHIMIWQQEHKPPLYPYKQSCGAALQALVEKEKEKLQLWRQQLATPENNGNTRQLHTRLNLSELAIVLRLLRETGVVQHRVMMEYFRCWAQWVQTGTDKPISAETLKSRYYQPEPGALGKVKDLLMEMRQKLAEW